MTDTSPDFTDLLLHSGQHPARVISVDRGAFMVRDEEGEIAAEVAGKLHYTSESDSELPCAGDWVGITRAAPDRAMIHQVLPRRTFLRRKRAGRTTNIQMVAAHVDEAFIFQSCHFDFNLKRLDRYRVMVRDGGIDPIIVLTKIDLVSPAELAVLEAAIRDHGISDPIYFLSNTTGEGVDEIQARMHPGRTYCLIGSSGVGKTSLLNQLLGEDLMETAEVSGTGEGTHTTTRRQLLTLPNGAHLLDTPGMRELGLLGTEEGVGDSFEDIQELAQACRFSNCAHTQEPGCAVTEAIESGNLDPHRLTSYHKLQKETEHLTRSRAEQRQQNKALGKMVKQHTQHKRR